MLWVSTAEYKISCELFINSLHYVEVVFSPFLAVLIPLSRMVLNFLKFSLYQLRESQFFSFLLLMQRISAISCQLPGHAESLQCLPNIPSVIPMMVPSLPSYLVGKDFDQCILRCAILLFSAYYQTVSVHYSKSCLRQHKSVFLLSLSPFEFSFVFSTFSQIPT